LTLEIDLPPDVEERLIREAGREGLNAGEYAVRLITRQLSPEPRRKSLMETLSPEEWRREFRAWVESHDPEKPPLPPEATERASFYGERG
jgi:hypothetical protein